jgi:hypothetical protein
MNEQASDPLYYPDCGDEESVSDPILSARERRLAERAAEKRTRAAHYEMLATLSRPAGLLAANPHYDHAA